LGEELGAGFDERGKELVEMFLENNSIVTFCPLRDIRGG
jgi:hypothetical protein